MTNAKKKKNSQMILETWTTLKTKILSLKPVLENKALIIEAVQFHLQQASFFTTEHSSEPLLNRRLMEQEKKHLTQQLEELAQQQAELGGSGRRGEAHFGPAREQIKTELTKLEVALTASTTAQTAFASQKVKYQQIVQDCQELLSKLESI